MTAQEFKEKYPHLAHLEGNELWDAMAMAVLKEQPPREVLPDDNEIAYTQKINSYTFGVTKGLDRILKEFMKNEKPIEFNNYGLIIPSLLTKHSKQEKEMSFETEYWWGVEMYKNVGTIENPVMAWVCDLRIYYCEKSLSDFDLKNVPGLRQNAKFLYTKPAPSHPNLKLLH